MGRRLLLLLLVEGQEGREPRESALSRRQEQGGRSKAGRQCHQALQTPMELSTAAARRLTSGSSILLTGRARTKRGRQAVARAAGRVLLRRARARALVGSRDEAEPWTSGTACRTSGRQQAATVTVLVSAACGGRQRSSVLAVTSLPGHAAARAGRPRALPPPAAAAPPGDGTVSEPGRPWPRSVARWRPSGTWRGGAARSGPPVDAEEGRLEPSSGGAARPRARQPPAS